VSISAIDQNGNQIRSAGLSSPGANALWSITIPSFDTPTDITFYVNVYHFSRYILYVENLAPGVTDQDITGIAINLGDFPSPIADVIPFPLSSNIWMNGNITSGGVVDWYSINVTQGTTYYLWWNDRLSGDRNQSLDIDVYVFDSNGIVIFSGDDMGYDPIAFISDSNGTVYISARSLGGGGSTGTYQIVYSTGDSRTGGW